MVSTGVHSCVVVSSRCLQHEVGLEEGLPVGLANALQLVLHGREGLGAHDLVGAVVAALLGLAGG